MFSVHTRSMRVKYCRASLQAQRAPRSRPGRTAIAIAFTVAGLCQPAPILAQRSDSADVESLTTLALGTSPTLRAARARVEAARSRVSPAGLRADPMLMIGVQNLPISDPGFTDEMTMKMVGVGQTIPYPGKLALSRRVAERELAVAEAAAEGFSRGIVRDVRDAYYELAFLDRALDIAERNRDVLTSLNAVTEARYGAGTTGQQDVLKARVEAARLAETAVDLTERRRGTLARLNALLDRPSDSPIEGPVVPGRIARAAIVDSTADVRFTSAALGARASDSPLPAIEELQSLALRESPALREADATIAAQQARSALAQLGSMPDFDISVQYGQRSGYADMVSATVAIPLPLQKRRSQDAQVTEVRAELSALEADRHARRNEVLAEVARLHSELERDRAQLALYVRSIIPQGRASLTSATSSYQVGRTELLTLLDHQATLFSYEMQYFRLLSDFASTLAELEQVIGKEVLP